MKGLIIKKHWGEKILKGEKLWEIRGSNTSYRGETQIIFSGTNLIYGTANLVDTKRMSTLDLHFYFPKHLVTDEVSYLKPWAWIFEDAKFFDKPIPYTHPQGAVIWVNL